MVELAKAGDRAAFGELYRLYHHRVLMFVFFKVGRNRILAEDLTADAFARALKGICNVDYVGRDIGGWFTTIARNLVMDHFKSARTRLEIPVDDMCGSDSMHEPAAVDDPERTAIAYLTDLTLHGAVKQLNPEQQECIVLRFLRGLTVAETARAMGKNEGAIKALQYRAVRALGKLLPDGFEEAA